MKSSIAGSFLTRLATDHPGHISHLGSGPPRDVVDQLRRLLFGVALLYQGTVYRDGERGEMHREVSANRGFFRE